jgi:hypothetical protein
VIEKEKSDDFSFQIFFDGRACLCEEIAFRGAKSLFSKISAALFFRFWSI